MIFCPPGDCFFFNNEMEFSTFDNDNDALSDFNCAAELGGGNWWGYGCGLNNINGKYGGNSSSGTVFMYWYGFDYNNHWQALKTMTLMFRQVN